MNWITNLYTNHQVLTTSITILLISTAVGAMPSPTFTSSGFYRWLFDFLHAFTGGLFRVVATHNPNFQADSGAQPYRPENANGTPAKVIKEVLQKKVEVCNDNTPWKPKGAK